MDRLVIIDGNAVMHRAYHALPPMNTAEGIPTNAVYGFTSMLLRLVKDLKPTHMAVAFDRPAPTFRKKLFKEYQSKRPKMDDELSSQIDLVHEVVEAFGVPIYEMDGYEADDVIGTLVQRVFESTKYEAQNSNQRQNTKSKTTKNDERITNNDIDQIIIVTGDRDILQLVDDRVFVYMPTKGLSEAKLYDAKETEKKLGVPPQKVVELKALMGDSSDNYPGVAGVGPKTAKLLIDAYGSVEALYEALDRDADEDIPEKTRTKLLIGKDSALLSHDLATIRRDAPVAVDVSDTKLGELDTEDVHIVFERLGFYSLLKRLSSATSDDSAEEKKQSKKKEKKKAETDTQQSLF